MKREIYYQLSDGCDVCEVVMKLSTCIEWIKADEDTEDDEREYTLKPIWLTEDEYENLPEANI